MSNITLKQMEYFVSLARLRHFGRAAQDCAISQPALSIQIRNLETELGGVLFRREARRVILTEFGNVVLSRIHQILRDVEDLGDLARASNDPLVGRLRIGIIPTVAPYLLPLLIRDFTSLYPDLHPSFSEMTTQRLLKEVSEGCLDAAIVSLPLSQPTLNETTLFTEKFVFIRPAMHAGPPIPTGEDLRKMPLLLMEEGHCFRDQVLSFCNMTAGQASEQMSATSLTTLVQMVGAGIGVTLIPEIAVPVEVNSVSVSVVRFDDPQPRRTIGMVWRKTSALADQLLKICDVVRHSAETQQFSE